MVFLVGVILLRLRPGRTARVAPGTLRGIIKQRPPGLEPGSCPRILAADPLRYTLLPLVRAPGEPY
jgi:hypothetical protein